MLSQNHSAYSDLSCKADFVQDLYLRELKSYKPPPVKASDSEGLVQTFSLPKAPQSPEESDIANELKEYEAQQVEVEGQADPAEAEKEWTWYEEPEDPDEVEENKAAAH